MAEDEDGTRRPPKIVKFRPKGSPKEDPVVPTSETKFETAADEWVMRPRSGEGSITMTALAKKWGVHRVTLQKRKKKEDWEKRKLGYERLVEEKKARLSTTPHPTLPLQDATDPDESKDTIEATRQARVEESSADKRARVDIIFHEIDYALVGALANAMEVEKVRLMLGPKTLSELARTAKTVAEVSAMVIGKPEPPPKQVTRFEAIFNTRGGAINTIERLQDETLEDAMARLDNEHSEAKERLLSSFMKPAVVS